MVNNHVTVNMNDLRALVREVVLEVLADYMEGDPDAGLTFKADVAEYLRRYRDERLKGTLLQEVIKEIGLR